MLDSKGATGLHSRKQNYSARGSALAHSPRRFARKQDGRNVIVLHRILHVSVCHIIELHARGVARETDESVNPVAIESAASM